MRLKLAAFLCSSVMLTKAAAVPLDIALTAAPAINCVFDLDCTITVTDFSDHFVLPATAGDGFLQSRLWPVGEAGTPGAGLYAYLYRIDVRNLVGVTALPCVYSLTIEFGPVQQLDYDGDGDLDHVWVSTSGLGSIGPAVAEQTGNSITFLFTPGVCTGSFPGDGESSYFFGLASTLPPTEIEAELHDNLGAVLFLEARGPAYGTPPDAFRRGDLNGDGFFNIADPISLLDALFGGAPPPACPLAGDANDDGVLNIADAVAMLNVLFVPGSPPLPPPVTACGTDPTPSSLACGSYPPCP